MMSLAPPKTDVSGESAVWAEFVALPENESALLAVRSLARGFTHPQSRPKVPVPLVLHGATGTGKTFLVQKLVRELIADPNGHTVQLVVAREFAADQTEMADAKDCDLLVVEDLQHLPARSVVHFCQLLDERARRRKPTVVTANQGPAGLKALPRRLTSRLGSGLVIHLEPLRQQSREDLLARFAGSRKVSLTAEAVSFLAKHAHGSGIRPLVGLVEQLRVLSKGRAGAWGVDDLRAALAHELTDRRGPVERIVGRVATAFGVKPKDVLGTGRQRAVMIPRQVAMYLAHEGAKMPLVKVGSAFGGRDHTTVLHACRKIAAAIKSDPKLRRTVRDLKSECR